MDKEISFIVEFDEVDDNQLNKFNEFLEDTMIKFQILKSDYEFKENTNLKQALNEIREYIDKHKRNLINPISHEEYEELDDENINNILQIIDKYLGGNDE